MIKKDLIQEIINIGLRLGGDFVEIFVENKEVDNIEMVAGNIEKSISGIEYGLGIRIFKDNNSVYAYTSDTSRNNLIELVNEACLTISVNKPYEKINLHKNIIQGHHNIIMLPNMVNKNKKIELMKRAYYKAKDYDESILQVKIRYMDYVQDVLISNSEGLFVEDRRVRTRTAIQTTASDGKNMQTGFMGPGAHMGFDFYNTINIEDYAKESARMAKTMLHSQDCPSGPMTVVIDNKFGGVIFHEACGHGLEATSVAKGTSIFANKIGHKVASDLVTAVDDGTIPNGWGSQNIDDEGIPTKKNILIENGILKGYMVDRLNGKRLKMDPTGSGRRQSYKYPPTSRMTNTYIQSGNSKKSDIIANTENGLYAKYMGGGSVNPATGDFNFAVLEGYLIKNGKIDRPVKGATLIGNGKNVLMNIDMVGDNLAHGQGICGSSSGMIPTNVGQPTIRVSSMIVGGRGGQI